MKVISIAEILFGHIATNQKITVRGWIRTRRDSKIGLSFLSIYDGSCLNPIQAIARHSLPNYQEEVLRITTGTSVIVKGQLTSSPGKNQSFEIQVSSIKIIGSVQNPNTYPISAKQHTLEYLREVAHLRPRTNLIGAISRIRHTVFCAIHRFFDEKGYLWVPTPIITSLDAEGIGKIFRVSTLDIENPPVTEKGKINYKQDFFGKESFLTVSGQLNCEAYACALSKVYTFGPTFRAENSNTSRHLAEFWMLEPETAFANLEDTTKLAEEMLKYIFAMVLQNREDDMEFCCRKTKKKIILQLDRFISKSFVHLDYTDSINVLKKSGECFEKPISWGMDLSSEHERYLTDKYFKLPIVIKNYPKEVKAFYMRLNDDNKTVAAMDILFPGIGEIIGGSQREERLEILDVLMEEKKLNKEDYWWYLDLRRYGTVPHSGFGLGFERLISYITGVDNIRDVIAFPRTPRNLTF